MIGVVGGERIEAKAKCMARHFAAEAPRRSGQAVQLLYLVARKTDVELLQGWRSALDGLHDTYRRTARRTLPGCKPFRQASEASHAKRARQLVDMLGRS